MAFISRKLKKKSSKGGSDDWGTGRPGDGSKHSPSSTISSNAELVPTAAFQKSIRAGSDSGRYNSAPRLSDHGEAPSTMKLPSQQQQSLQNTPTSGYYGSPTQTNPSPSSYGSSPTVAMPGSLPGSYSAGGSYSQQTLRQDAYYPNRMQGTPPQQYSYPQGANQLQHPQHSQQRPVSSPMRTPLASPSNNHFPAQQSQLHTGEVHRHSPKLQQSPYRPTNSYPQLASPPAFGSSKPQDQIAGGPWKKKKLINSPFPRFSHSASSTTSEDGAIYVMGGLRDDQVYGDIWMISPTQKESINYSYFGQPVENFDRIPIPRVWHDSVLVGNAFIVFGGDTIQTTPSHELDNNLYFFNINSLKWTIPKPTGPRPRGRYGHRIAVVNFQLSEESDAWLSYLYLFGGELDNKYLNPKLDHEYFNDMWCFDLSNFRKPTTQWRQVIPKEGALVPPPLSGHTMTVYNDRVFVYGGVSDGVVSNRLFCFNPVEESWSECEIRGDFMPPPLQSHAATLYKNLLFIYGGKGGDKTASTLLFCIDLKTLAAFRLETNFSNGPGPRYGHSMTVDVLNSKLIIMGGEQADDNLDHLDSSNDAVVNYDAHTTAIYEFDLTLLKDYINKSDLDSLTLLDFPIDSEEDNQSADFDDAASELKNIDSVEPSETDDFTSAVSSTPLTQPQEFEERDISPVKDASPASPASQGQPLSSARELEIPFEGSKTISTSPVTISKNQASITTVGTAAVAVVAGVSHASRSGTSPTSRDVSGANSNRAASEEKLSALTQMVSNLKLEMSNRVQEADRRISELENTRSENEVKIQQLRNEISDKDEQLAQLDQSSRSLSAEPESVSALRRSKVELGTQLASLQTENASLKKQVDEFNPQFQKHVSDLGSLNSIVKSQSAVIEKLQASLIGESDLKKEVNEWKMKYDNLLNDHENIKSVYQLNLPDDVEGDEAAPKDVHSKINDISANVDSILASWSDRGVSTRDSSENDNESSLGQLKAHISELLEANQEQETKLVGLEKEKNDLEAKVVSLEEKHTGFKQTQDASVKEAEENHKKLMHTLNNTSKALNLSHSEVEKLRDLNKKLVSENENLKLFKASHRSSSRSATPVIGAFPENSTPAGNDVDAAEDEDDVVNHYDLKIKDMEADLFIVTQERDQLKEEVHALKKKLFGR
ncbi:unnamed protein product [Kuraishia capsulata CBS 1993]|uniref:Uncharacterized protein n=1 Tax=Kuraishia capsulata CBS 1993 TaxID=1382522 RepID=W6MH41_9ASCO|nr:uncharacterized protein KUCA_T00001228001 [Kuraishia capsulata CBS 1993]CDK25261.1 unnamed protein product [Kuraishia capsulata CBS 1993]